MPKPTVNVTFSDETGTYTSQTAAIIADAKAAFATWQKNLAPSNASIELNLHIVADSSQLGGGGSVTTAFVGTDGDLNVFEQGVAYELRTGIDPNGSDFDANIFFTVQAMDDYYWINPLDGTPLPDAKSDLVDVIAHEFGHVLGFNGFRDWSSYELSGDSESTFDAQMQQVGDYMYFTGAKATARYGSNPALTAGNVYHLGNNSPGPGSDLIPDLMNGIVFDYRDYDISKLDVAILSDIGLATKLSDRLVGGDERDRTWGGNGNDDMLGGGGIDHLYGGAGRDRLEGDAGGDFLSGGKGGDRFVLTGMSDSNAAAYDTIDGFDAAQDRFELWFKARLGPTVEGGQLRLKQFAHDLEVVFPGAELKPHHAVLFLPDSGKLKGEAVVVIDVNKVNGFQAGADAVVVLDDARHLDRFNWHTFIATDAEATGAADLARLFQAHDAVVQGPGLLDGDIFL